ncbi:MAG: hypothetical protein H6765_06560 [Candidatus Peribacteria bacterium]|nr:MAG: hypothetical protein H6765_06560 [Candidatus Peribacteria bacterium]
MRCYAGVIRTREPGVKIQQMYMFSSEDTGFVSSPAEQIIKHISLREDFMSEAFHKLGCTGGIEINLLSELPRGIGMGFAGTMSAALSSVLLLLSGHISPDSLDDYASFAHTSEYRLLILLATMMNASCMSRAPGLHAYASLAYGAEPVLRLNKLHLDAERKKIMKSDDIFAAYLDVEDRIEKKLVGELFSMRDIVQLPKQANLTPFDYSILYLGSSHASQRLQSSYK